MSEQIAFVATNPRTGQEFTFEGPDRRGNFELNLDIDSCHSWYLSEEQARELAALITDLYTK